MVRKRKKEVAVEKEPEVKRQQVYNLQLNKFELLHIRDLMGILLPPKGEMTLSRSLAAVEDREIMEEMLWEKVSSLCAEAKLPLAQEAPDYIVIPTSYPAMGVFQLHQEREDSQEGLSGFLPHGEGDDE